MDENSFPLEFTFVLSGLSGELPTSIRNLVNMEHFNTADNSFNGTLPTEIGKVRRESGLMPLFCLDMNINGTARHFYACTVLLHISPILSIILICCSKKLTGLMEFGLSHNSFTGEIPTEMGKMGSLM